MGCGGEEEAEIKVNAVFSMATMVDDASRVTLIVTDSNSNILITKDLPITGTTATDTIQLAEGATYTFYVKVENNGGYLIGEGFQTVEIKGSITISIPITIVKPPQPSVPVKIDVKWVDGGEKCQTIPALFFNNAAFVYNDTGTKTLNCFSPTGWMGDVSSMQFDDSQTATRFSGDTGIKIIYSAKGTLGWAGIYWLPVPKVLDDWSNVLFGIDLRGAKKLQWRAKGSVGGEKVEFFVGGVTSTKCPDSLPKITTPTKLSSLKSDWQLFEIDLSSIPSDQLKYVVGGFGWAANRDNNPNGMTFYLDEVKFLK